MGLAEFNDAESGEELFERADKALYKAKESGRNIVCTA
jgi:PleD family two-component response regulator